MQAQTSGPHVVAKPTMKKHAKTIMTVPEVFAVAEPTGASLNWNWPTEAKTRKHMSCQRAAM